MYIFNARNLDNTAEYKRVKSIVREYKTRPINISQREELQRFLLAKRGKVAWITPFNYIKTPADARNAKKYRELTNLLNRVNALKVG